FPGGDTEIGILRAYPIQYFYGDAPVPYHKSTFGEYLRIPMDENGDDIHIKLFGQIECPLMKSSYFIGLRSGAFREGHKGVPLVYFFPQVVQTFLYSSRYRIEAR